MPDIVNEIQLHLKSMADLKYRDFHSRLMPTVNKEAIIGVRVPLIRQYAREIAKREDIHSFLDSLPHIYYEENNLHAALVSQMKGSFNGVISEVEKFLPYIDNWATCDMFSPKMFKKYPHEVYSKCMQWIKSDKTYTVRFGIDILMSLFLDDLFKPEILEEIAAVKSEEYYINMAIAWFFSFALIKQYEVTIPLFENKSLDKWVHNKSIQKAVESKRISEPVKAYLKGLKIK